MKIYSGAIIKKLENNGKLNLNEERKKKIGCCCIL